MKLLKDVTSWAKLTEGGMIRLLWSEVVSTVFAGATPRNSFFPIASVGDEMMLVAEAEMHAAAFVGRTIGDLQLYGCEAVALRRNDRLIPGFQIVKFCRGDVITLVGQKAALKRARESLMTL